MLGRFCALFVATVFVLGLSVPPVAAQTTLAPKVILKDHSVRDQDDMCVWVHPTDPALSTIITSDKGADKVFVYGLDGETIQIIDVPGHPGNVDARYGFLLSGEKVDIVALNECEFNQILVFKVDVATRKLVRVDDGAIKTGATDGATLYHSPKTSKFYCIATAKTEDSNVPDFNEGKGIEQYELSDDGTGKVQGKKIVRAWPCGESEGCVADDETGTLYINEQKVGIWKLSAEPDDPTNVELVAKIGENDFLEDAEGVTIYYAAGGKGYIIVSSQGSSSLKVFDREPPHALIETFTVEGGRNTDGVDVANINLGPAFPEGLFALHTDPGGEKPCPVFVCSFEDIGLKTDTMYWDPRVGNAK